VSIGVLVARFFRSVWSKAFFFGEAAWFQVHRMLMLATSVLTCIAFVMPFVYRGGWSQRAGYHPYLGCTVMTLAVLQPLLAAFRPSLHDPSGSNVPRNGLTRTESSQSTENLCNDGVCGLAHWD
uniref:Ferric-chelate reductase 1 n=1 Tax=Nannospalax galili TaxID=1026970 RepID=A0A8C6WAJ9_NANGA